MVFYGVFAILYDELLSEITDSSNFSKDMETGISEGFIMASSPVLWIRKYY